MQRCTYDKYISVIHKCPKCGQKGYLELWKTEPPLQYVFKVKHTAGTHKGKSHGTTISTCFLTNEQADSLFNQHARSWTHAIPATNECHICTIYQSVGLLTPHGASL